MGTITERKRQDGSSAYTAQIRLKLEGRVRHTEAKTFNQRKAAERWLIKREEELAKGLPQPPRTIRSLIESFVADQEKNSAVRSLFNLIGIHESDEPRYALADLNALTITTAQVLEFVKVRRLEVKPSTVKFDLAQLRIVLAAAHTEQGLPIPLDQFDAALDYAKKKGWSLPSARRERRLTTDEEAQLQQHFRTSQSALPMSDLMAFALHSCRRLEEIMRLQWADYQPEKKTILVRDLKHPRTKRGNDRQSRLTKEAMAIIEAQPRIDERIFPYNPKSVGKNFYQTVRLLGIANLHFHDLRHEGISRLFEKGYAIHEVALFSLHRDWATLQRYTHLKAENVREID